jgi:hypothetical protein
LVNHKPLAVTAFNPTFPPELDQIVSRAIAKGPAQRYQCGMEMASDIQRLRETLGLPQKTAELTASRLKQHTIPHLLGTQRPTPDSGKRAAIQTVTKRVSDSKARAIFRVLEHRFCVFDDEEFWGEGTASESSSGWGQRGGQPRSAEDVHHAF